MNSRHYTCQLQHLARQSGWSVDRTKGNHYRLTHPAAAVPVFTSSTPSDRRTLANTKAQMRRAVARDRNEFKP